MAKMNMDTKIRLSNEFFKKISAIPRVQGLYDIIIATGEAADVMCMELGEYETWFDFKDRLVTKLLSFGYDLEVISIQDISLHVTDDKEETHAA